MEAIIPRWEWRTFGASFGEADRRFRALEPGRAQESEEVYLLSPRTDANVKVRDRLMDIKTLEQVNAEGLEQWRPVMKREFPLPAAEVARVCAALGVAPIAGLGAYTLEQLQAELTQASRGARVVQVHKRRQHYIISGCSAEMTDVVADGKPIRTVAIELEDPARVLAAVREMGLDRFENISYPRGLKRLLGLSP
jgi:exopolyphosphatase / guanosine-5'-triphosphate,3'-diphosphate pyrophosphatase